ncbi:MAG: hypothetical protein ABI665_00365 [Vicinamibacterales bacterium]
MTVLSLPGRAVRYALRRGNEAGHMVRGKYILYRYAAHYRRARRLYQRSNAPAARTVASLYETGVRVIRPAAGDAAIALPSGYGALVDRVARSVAAAFERSAHCHFFPGLPAGAMAERTADVPAVVNGEVIALQLLDPFVIDGVRDLCEPLLQELERALYGSFTIADKVYIYRNPVSHQLPRTSWRWHFDNHPREMLKVMVYLTDVDEGTAPFQYLRERSSGQPLAGSPLTPMFGNSRVADEDIERRLAADWICQSVTGPRGTIVVFDDNIIHRATLAKSAHRDVVVFQVRPAAFQPAARLDPKWTGSFGHRAFNGNPWELAPGPRA